MANLIQYAKDQVTEVTRKAYEAAAAAGVLPGGAELKGGVEIPRIPPTATTLPPMPWQPPRL